MRKVAWWRRKRRWMGVKMLSVQPLHATSVGLCEKVGRRDAGNAPLNPHTPPPCLTSSSILIERGRSLNAKEKKKYTTSHPPRYHQRTGAAGQNHGNPGQLARGIFSLLPVNQKGQGEATAPHAMPKNTNPATRAPPNYHHGEGGGCETKQKNQELLLKSQPSLTRLFISCLGDLQARLSFLSLVFFLPPVT